MTSTTWPAATNDSASWRTRTSWGYALFGRSMVTRSTRRIGWSVRLGTPGRRPTASVGSVRSGVTDEEAGSNARERRYPRMPTLTATVTMAPRPKAIPSRDPPPRMAIACGRREPALRMAIPCGRREPSPWMAIACGRREPCPWIAIACGRRSSGWIIRMSPRSSRPCSRLQAPNLASMPVFCSMDSGLFVKQTPNAKHQP
jgi:hypothetical protein